MAALRVLIDSADGVDPPGQRRQARSNAAESDDPSAASSSANRSAKAPVLGAMRSASLRTPATSALMASSGASVVSSAHSATALAHVIRTAASRLTAELPQHHESSPTDSRSGTHGALETRR